MAPPFAVQQPDGMWDGVAVHLWREMGEEAGFEAEVRGFDPDSLLPALEAGLVDVLLTVPVTNEADARADFTHTYYTATLGVAEKREAGGVTQVLKRFFSPLFFKVAAGLVVLLLLVGVLVWLAERKNNSDDYPEEARLGIWNGFWWAGVTMTTIGYGDISPKTVPGRSLALLWMLVSMALTAALTTALVAALGLGQGASGENLRFPSDLRDRRVAAVEGSGAVRLLQAEQIAPRLVSSVNAGLEALSADSVDALAASAPLLRHALRQSDAQNVRVVTTQEEPVRMALAVPEASPLQEPLGYLVVERTQGASWRALLERWGVTSS